jgi:hypothetical protein
MGLCIAKIARSSSRRRGEGGRLHRLKKHLAGVRGQVLPCDAPNEVIGQIRMDMFNQFEKFEEEKARQKEINDEIGRKEATRWYNESKW